MSNDGQALAWDGKVGLDITPAMSDTSNRITGISISVRRSSTYTFHPAVRPATSAEVSKMVLHEIGEQGSYRHVSCKRD